MRRSLRMGALIAWVCGAHAGDGAAQEIAPYRLTSVDGYVSVRYLTDANTTGTRASGAVSASRARESVSDLRADTLFMTHGYVYHPNLLLLDLGAGPVLQRGSFGTESGDTRSSAMLYNLAARATFLRDKPYRGSIFYEHLNPTLSVAPGQVVNQESTRFGFDVSLLEPVTPVPVTLDATRSRFKGRGVDRIVDDLLDRMNLRASRSFGALGMTQLNYQAAKQDSQSGSPNLPIQASSSNTQNFSADTRLQFGPDRKYTLVNLINLNSQRYQLATGAIPDRRDAQVFLDLRAIHSPALNSFVTATYGNSDQGTMTAKRQSATAGFTHSATPALQTAASARAEGSRTTEFDARSWGVDGSARYQRDLPVGTVQASAGVNYERRDQRGIAPQTSVIGERLTLAGTAYATLAHQRVIAGTLVVSNAQRTQTFVDGVDYRVDVIGVDTRIQRLIGGSIADGQEVLADYGYDVGGTYALDQLNQNYSLNWSVSRFVNLYLRVFDAAPHLVSGTPTFQLNTVRSTTAGARADVPLLEDGKLVKTYPIAVGARFSPSPDGEFTVVNHAKDPVYRHKGKEIQPGKDNPLGNRWMGLSLKGYGIHGTNVQSSIGKAVSHGCFRMTKQDVEDLYTRVQVGDTVIIRRERDELIAKTFATQTPVDGTRVQVAAAETGETTQTASTGQ